MTVGHRRLTGGQHSISHLNDLMWAAARCQRKVQNRFSSVSSLLLRNACPIHIDWSYWNSLRKVSAASKCWRKK